MYQNFETYKKWNKKQKNIHIWINIIIKIWLSYFLLYSYSFTRAACGRVDSISAGVQINAGSIFNKQLFCWVVSRNSQCRNAHPRIHYSETIFAYSMYVRAQVVSAGSGGGTVTLVAPMSAPAMGVIAAATPTNAIRQVSDRDLHRINEI